MLSDIIYIYIAKESYIIVWCLFSKINRSDDNLYNQSVVHTRHITRIIIYMDERRRKREREGEGGRREVITWMEEEREGERGRERSCHMAGRKEKERERQEGREVIFWQRDSSCQLATIPELAFLRDSGLDYYSSSLSDCQFVLDDIS